MVVPQTSQTALVAFLPFFIVTPCAFLPSLFVRHFTQYIIYIVTPLPRTVIVNWAIHLTLQIKYITTSRLRMKLTRIRLFIMSDLTVLTEPSCAKRLALFTFCVCKLEGETCFFNCPLTLEAKPLFFELGSHFRVNWWWAKTLFFRVLLFAIPFAF